MTPPSSSEATSSEKPLSESPVPATPGLLRSINNRVVLELLIKHTTLSRGDVCTLTGLSKPTASQLLTRLEESGLVVDAGLGKPRPGGRAPQLYRLNPLAGFAAALDVTPSRIHARVANIVGDLLGEASIPTEAPHGPTGPARAILALETAAATAGITLDQLDATVIGAPGSYDALTDRLRFSDHLHDWQQPGLAASLATVTGSPVFIENDVNLVAVAEQRASAADADNFFLLWLDERIGGALVIDGRLYRGSSGAAGEAAFLQLPGVPVVRNPAQDNRGGFEDLVGEDVIRRLASESGLAADSAAEVIAVAVATDSEAADTLLTEVASRYAIGLASILALLDPQHVLLSGSLMQAGGETLRARIAAELAAVAITTPPLQLGRVTDVPIIQGAMMLSLEHARDRVFAT